jgi:hypothetical protein
MSQPMQPIRSSILLERPCLAGAAAERHSSHHLQNLSDSYRQWASSCSFFLGLVLVLPQAGGRAMGRRIEMAEYLMNDGADFEVVVNI